MKKSCCRCLPFIIILNDSMACRQPIGLQAKTTTLFVPHLTDVLARTCTRCTQPAAQQSLADCKRNAPPTTTKMLPTRQQLLKAGPFQKHAQATSPPASKGGHVYVKYVKYTTQDSEARLCSTTAEDGRGRGFWWHCLGLATLHVQGRNETQLAVEPTNQPHMLSFG